MGKPGCGRTAGCAVPPSVFAPGITQRVPSFASRSSSTHSNIRGSLGRTKSRGAGRDRANGHGPPDVRERIALEPRVETLRVGGAHPGAFFAIHSRAIAAKLSARAIFSADRLALGSMPAAGWARVHEQEETAPSATTEQALGPGFSALMALSVRGMAGGISFRGRRIPPE